MIGEIYIDGTIGKFKKKDGTFDPFTELVDVVTQVNKLKDATSYKVNINTVGGYTYIAKQIRNYLMGLGKVIHTHGHGVVASSGTIIHSAGTIRTLENPNTPYMIHLPSGEIGGTSDEILAYSNMMQKEQKEIIDIYIEATGLTKEALTPLVSNETWLTPKQAYELNFLTSEPVEIKAIAKYNKPVNKEDMSEKKKITQEQQKLFTGFLEKLTKMFAGGEAPKNILIQTSIPEVEIDFAGVMEGEPIVVDATATVNGEPAEGEHVLPSGETYVFTAGVLTEIKPKEEEASEAFEELTAKFEALELTNKANIENLATEKLRADEATAKLTESTATLATAKVEFDEFKAVLKSKVDFTAMKEEKKADEVQGGTSRMMANLERIKKERNNRNKK